MENKNQPIKQDFFNAISSEFDNHVRESIPLFSECVQNIRENIIKHYNEASILDICGSTGKIGADLFSEGFEGKYTNIDGSPCMIDLANKLKQANNDRHINTLGGFMCGWNDNGVDIPHVDTKGKTYDISLEILGFQFFTKERRDQILELKNSVKLGGLSIFVEKFSNSDVELWNRNEILKDTLHKSNHFTPEQIEAKKENVLIDMGAYCYDYDLFEGLLLNSFMHTKQIYKAGNFAAYVCSDSPILWDTDTVLINNKFNSK